MNLVLLKLFYSGLGSLFVLSVVTMVHQQVLGSQADRLNMIKENVAGYLSLSTSPRSSVSSDIAFQTTYVMEHHFIIDHPDNWVFKATSDTYTLTNYSPQSDRSSIPIDAIKTVIKVDQNHFQEVVSQALSPLRNNDSTQVTKQKDTSINGRKATQIWVTATGNELPNRLSTYIRYSNARTVVMTSYYHPQNADAELLIDAIHQSFRVFE